MNERSGWDRHRITEKILAASARWERVDYQQLRQIAWSLKKANPEEVFEGLYRVFTNGSDDYRARFVEQEYAGRLLLECRPPCNKPVRDVLLGVLGRWNLSIEQLPWYLAYTFGARTVCNCIDEILKELASEWQVRSAQTMRCDLTPIKRRKS